MTWSPQTLYRDTRNAQQNLYRDGKNHATPPLAGTLTPFIAGPL
jgi:hypothetical protein